MVNSLDRALNSTFSRRTLLKGTFAVSVGTLAASAFGTRYLAGVTEAATAVVAAPLDSDLDILNYALTLELLEAAAYKAINDANVLTGRAKTYFQAFGQHEQAHVDALTATIQKLGGTPVRPPAAGYNFSSVPKDMAGIVATFKAIEDVGASAYLGAAAAIKDNAVLLAGLSIHAVEAEHASALSDLTAPGTEQFTPDGAFAKPRTPDEVVRIVTPYLTPTAAAPTPAMPGLPNTGGGYQASKTSDRSQELLGLLGLFGAGAAALGALSRRSRTNTAEPAETQRQEG